MTSASVHRPGSPAAVEVPATGGGSSRYVRVLELSVQNVVEDSTAEVARRLEAGVGAVEAEQVQEMSPARSAQKSGSPSSKVRMRSPRSANARVRRRRALLRGPLQFSMSVVTWLLPSCRVLALAVASLNVGCGACDQRCRRSQCSVIPQVGQVGFSRCSTRSEDGAGSCIPPPTTDRPVTGGDDLVERVARTIVASGLTESSARTLASWMQLHLTPSDRSASTARGRELLDRLSAIAGDQSVGCLGRCTALEYLWQFTPAGSAAFEVAVSSIYDSTCPPEIQLDCLWMAATRGARDDVHARFVVRSGVDLARAVRSSSRCSLVAARFASVFVLHAELFSPEAVQIGLESSEWQGFRLFFRVAMRRSDLDADRAISALVRRLSEFPEGSAFDVLDEAHVRRPDVLDGAFSSLASEWPYSSLLEMYLEGWPDREVDAELIDRIRRDGLRFNGKRFEPK